MGIGLKRSELQSIAKIKLKDAQLLLAHKRYANAYYLAGYSVEIGLKACIARQIVVETIPDRTWIKKIFQHDFISLIGAAGLAEELKNKQDEDSNFGANWGIAAQWNPDTRYLTKDAYSAQIIIESISDKDHGVLPWIQTHW